MTQTAQVLAGAMGVSEEEIASATTKNFFKLFDLGPDVGN
jgi:Tat protein secretion system quality control protein TatD with DNase activity